MNELETKLEYTVSESPRGGVSVIIVAAGSSSRMRGVNKQLSPLCGVPLIVRTLKAFEDCQKIKSIILVVRAEDVFTMQNLAQRYMITKLTDIVCGGDCRQQSVLNGFARLARDEKQVLIHDGARPLVSEEVICSVADALENNDCVICGVPPKDTIKEIDLNGRVVATPDRSKLFSVQTPQGVKVEKYLKAAKSAKDYSLFTDDASVMEWGGYEVATVLGDYTNIKVTTPEDIIVAEGIISRLGGNEK